MSTKGLRIAIAVIAALLLVLGICAFAVGFTFINDELFSGYQNWGTSDASKIDWLGTLLRNVSIAGGVSTVIVMILGIIGALAKIKVLVILHIVGDSLNIIIVCVCAIIPIIVSAFLTVSCDGLTACYKCPDDDCTNVISYNCFYTESDYDAICVDFRIRINFIVGAFFTLAIFSLVNSILGCVYTCAPGKDTGVVQQTAYVTTEMTVQQPQYAPTQQSPPAYTQ